MRYEGDHHLAQPAPLTRSLNPWALTGNDSLGSSSDTAHICDVTSSLSNKGSVENGTDFASSASALEDIVSDECMQPADTVIPKSNYAVSLSSFSGLRRSFKEYRLHSRIHYSARPWSRRCLGLTAHGFWISMSRCSQKHGLRTRYH